jgi:drug/metabolite transporter (DMT)-like permease
MFSHPRMQAVFGALILMWGIYMLITPWNPSTPELMQILMQLYAIPLAITGMLFWVRMSEIQDARGKRLLRLLGIMFIMSAIPPTAIWLGIVTIHPTADPKPLELWLGLTVTFGGILTSILSFFNIPWRKS